MGSPASHNALACSDWRSASFGRRIRDRNLRPSIAGNPRWACHHARALAIQLRLQSNSKAIRLNSTPASNFSLAMSAILAHGGSLRNSSVIRSECQVVQIRPVIEPPSSWQLHARRELKRADEMLTLTSRRGRLRHDDCAANQSSERTKCRGVIFEQSLVKLTKLFFDPHSRRRFGCSDVRRLQAGSSPL